MSTATNRVGSEKNIGIESCLQVFSGHAMSIYIISYQNCREGEEKLE